MSCLRILSGMLGWTKGPLFADVYSKTPHGCEDDLFRYGGQPPIAILHPDSIELCKGQNVAVNIVLPRFVIGQPQFGSRFRRKGNNSPIHIDTAIGQLPNQAGGFLPSVKLFDRPRLQLAKQSVRIPSFFTAPDELQCNRYVHSCLWEFSYSWGAGGAAYKSESTREPPCTAWMAFCISSSSMKVRSASTFF